MESSPSLPNFSKDYWKLLSLLISINWPSLMTWDVVQKMCSKMHLVSCTNTHRDVTDLVNHGMVKNTKTWISWERNIIFLQNKKILNTCFRCHILRSYHFVAKVTFKWLLKSKFVDNNSKSWPEKGSSLKIKVPIRFFVRIHTVKGMCSLCVNLIYLIKRNHVQAGPC